MPEKHQKDNDRDLYAEQPEKNSGASSFPYQYVSADSRRLRQLRGTPTVLAILQAA